MYAHFQYVICPTKSNFAHRSISKLPSHKSSKPVEEKALCKKKKTNNDIKNLYAKQNGFPFCFGYQGANFIDKQGYQNGNNIFCLTEFNGKLFVHVTLCMQKNIARRNLNFLLCAFVAVLLEINQSLDRLIIQLVWYILFKTIIHRIFGEGGGYLPHRYMTK